MRNSIKLLAIGMVVLQLFSLASALTINDVLTNPGKVEPGSSVSLEIELENEFGDDISDVEVGLEFTTSSGSEVPLSPEVSSVVYVDEIEEDDEETVKFNLIADADAEAGTYKIPVVMTYLVNGDVERTTKKFTVSVTISAEPILVLSTESNLIRNRINELEVRITNTGLAEAKLLEVELQDSALYEIVSSNKVYIGDLDSDDFDTADFSVVLKNSGAVSFPVLLKYRDATNEQIVKTETLNVKVYSEDEALQIGLIQKNNTLTYVGVVIGLIVVWLIWRILKKRRKRKKAQGGN